MNFNKINLFLFLITPLFFVSCGPKGMDLFKRFNAKDTTYTEIPDHIDISAYNFFITYVSKKKNGEIKKDSVYSFKVKIGEKYWMGYDHKYGYGYLYISPTIQIKIDTKQTPNPRFVFLDTDEQIFYGDYLKHSYLITEKVLTIWIDTKGITDKLLSKHLYITVTE